MPQDIHTVSPPCSSQSLGRFLFKREAWNCMPRLKLEVLRKPLMTDMVIAAHAICVRTTMPFLSSLKISQVSNYKISITLLQILKCLGGSFLSPNAKYENAGSAIIFPAFLCWHISIYNRYSLNPLFFRCGCCIVGRIRRSSLSNCSLNQSRIFFPLMRRTKRFPLSPCSIPICAVAPVTERALLCSSE